MNDPEIQWDKWNIEKNGLVSNIRFSTPKI